MILQMIIGAFALCITMYFVGRHEAENDLRINLMISAAVGVVTGILSVLLGILALPLGFVLCMWAVNKFAPSAGEKPRSCPLPSSERSS